MRPGASGTGPPSTGTLKLPAGATSILSVLSALRPLPLLTAGAGAGAEAAAKGAAAAAAPAAASAAES